MSYDLVVWHESLPITADIAHQKYEAICSLERLPGFHISVAQFIDSLTSVYPQLDDWAEEDLGECPWTCEFDSSSGHCIMNIRWGFEDLIQPKVIEIAMNLGLICYDPQSQTVHTPNCDFPD